jgi:hypothetical protein
MYLKTPPIKAKVAEKTMLNTTKTAVNPKIKLTVPAIGFGRLSSALPEAGEPPIIHRYEGISGSTHGDKNDINPAPNAIKTDKFSFMILFYLINDSFQDQKNQLHGSFGIREGVTGFQVPLKRPIGTEYG